MAGPEDELEALIRRSDRRASPSAWPMADPLAIGHCVCGARLTIDDVYGQRGDVDLGQPRRLSSERVYQYRCPLCGHTGELTAE
jgi:hypothetical protein